MRSKELTEIAAETGLFFFSKRDFFMVSERVAGVRECLAFYTSAFLKME